MPPSVATAASRCPELSLVMEYHLRLEGADVRTHRTHRTQFVAVNVTAELLRTLFDETKLRGKLCIDEVGCKELENLKMDLHGRELKRYELANFMLV